MSPRPHRFTAGGLCGSAACRVRRGRGPRAHAGSLAGSHRHAHFRRDFPGSGDSDRPAPASSPHGHPATHPIRRPEWAVHCASSKFRASRSTATLPWWAPTFPHNTAITILWGLSARLTPLSTTGYSDGHGGLRASLSVPASAPGLYRVLAEVQGVPYARANYDIVSLASLESSVTPAQGGGTLSIYGKKFVPGFRLTLIAYSTVSGRKPIVLGTVQVNSRGHFTFNRPVNDLEPGQYVLRAWSASSVAAEMAQTFFEVVV